MNVNGIPIEAFKEHMRISKAIVLNGNPELVIGQSTHLMPPFKFEINGVTRTITDLTPEPIVDIVVPVEEVKESV